MSIFYLSKYVKNRQPDKKCMRTREEKLAYLECIKSQMNHSRYQPEEDPEVQKLIKKLRVIRERQ